MEDAPTDEKTICNYWDGQIPLQRRENVVTIRVRAKYGCNVIAIRQNEKLIIPPSAEQSLRPDDILVIVGENSILQTFEVTFAE